MRRPAGESSSTRSGRESSASRSRSPERAGSAATAEGSTHRHGSPGSDPSAKTQSAARRKTLAACRQAGYLPAGNRKNVPVETIAEQCPAPCRAGRGGLRMTLASLDAAGRVGKEFTYKIEVTNKRRRPRPEAAGPAGRILTEST